MSEFRKLRALVGRELIGEMRTLTVLTATVVFPPLVLVIFRFSFDLGEVGTVVDWPALTPGILWTAFAFSGVLSLSRSFAAEKEDDRWLGLMLAPVDRGTMYLAKMVANSLYLLLVAVITLPIYEVFFNAGVFANAGALCLVVVLGLVGIAAIGTLLSAMAVNTRAREALLPLLMLPVLTPVLIAATQATRGLLAGGTLAENYRWLIMLGAVDVLFVSTGWLLFEFVVEE